MRFKPVVETLVWGTSIWEVSAYPGKESVVKEGENKGKKLSALEPNFPIIAKVISTVSRSSVQVHPNIIAAEKYGGKAKTEMWCLLEDGVIFAGLKPGVSPDDLAWRLAENADDLEPLLVRHEGKKGDVFFIPCGMIHTYEAGIKIYEIQETSDTTYRLSDWGRVGLDGKARMLHRRQALASIDFNLLPPTPQKEVKCEHFNFSQRVLNKETEFTAPENSFLLVYEVERGVSTLLMPNESVKIAPGWILLTTK